MSAVVAKGTDVIAFSLFFSLLAGNLSGGGPKRGSVARCYLSKDLPDRCRLGGHIAEKPSLRDSCLKGIMDPKVLLFDIVYNAIDRRRSAFARSADPQRLSAICGVAGRLRFRPRARRAPLIDGARDGRRAPFHFFFDGFGLAEIRCNWSPPGPAGNREILCEQTIRRGAGRLRSGAADRCRGGRGRPACSR